MVFVRVLSGIILLWLVGCTSGEKQQQGHHHGHHHHHAHQGGKATPGGVHHRFDDAEKWAKKFDDPARDQWQKPKEVIEVMKIKPGMKVADIGAGTGYFLPHLDKAVGAKGEVLALEVEPNLVDHMKKRIAKEKLATTKAQVIPFYDPKLPKGSMDRLLIVDTWHHIGKRDQYAQKLKQSLRSGGKVYIVDFEPGAKGPGPSQKHRLAANQVVQELAKAGFKTKVISETLPHQYIVVGY